MLTEAVQDGGQAMRDPVGGSVEFHFVPILKLISTLLIMGVFENADVKHILKMIEPTVFSGEAEDAAQGEGDQTLALKERGLEVKEEEKGAVESGHETEMEDEGMGEEDEEMEAELEELEPIEKEEDGEKVDGEKGAEETEKEATPGEADGEAEEQVGLEEGLLHMKLPESVKLQVGVCVSLITSL